MILFLTYAAQSSILLRFKNMSEKSKKPPIEELEPSAELLAAARAAYAELFSSFWEELTERLYPAGDVEVTPLPRRDGSGTV